MANGIITANFRIASSAKKEIENLRRIFEAKTKLKADVVMVGWGEYDLNDGRKFGNVIISFYDKAKRHEIEQGIQVVDGIEILFFTIPKYSVNFDRKFLIFNRGEFKLASGGD